VQKKKGLYFKIWKFLITNLSRMAQKPLTRYQQRTQKISQGSQTPLSKDGEDGEDKVQEELLQEFDEQIQYQSQQILELQTLFRSLLNKMDEQTNISNNTFGTLIHEFKEFRTSMQQNFDTFASSKAFVTTVATSEKSDKSEQHSFNTVVNNLESNHSSTTVAEKNQIFVSPRNKLISSVKKGTQDTVDHFQIPKDNTVLVPDFKPTLIKEEILVERPVDFEKKEIKKAFSKGKFSRQIKISQPVLESSSDDESSDSSVSPVKSSKSKKTSALPNLENPKEYTKLGMETIDLVWFSGWTDPKPSIYWDC